MVKASLIPRPLTMAAFHHLQYRKADRDHTASDGKSLMAGDLGMRLSRNVQ